MGVLAATQGRGGDIGPALSAVGSGFPGRPGIGSYGRRLKIKRELKTLIKPFASESGDPCSRNTANVAARINHG